MGQESMFPGLDRLRAQAALMRAQQGAAGLPLQEYQQQQRALGALGGGFSELYGGGMPGAAPMPPAPGESSVATRPFPTVGDVPISDRSEYVQPPGIRFTSEMGPAGPQLAGPSPSEVAMQGLPGGPTPQQGEVPAPGAASQPGQRQIGLAEVIAAIKKHDPNVDDATLAAAAQYYMPFMNADDKLILAQMHDAASLERTKLRIDSSNWRAGLQSSDRGKALAQKTDDAAQRLALAEKQFSLSQSRESRIAYFNALAAKHDADMNAIQMLWANGDMTDEDKKAAQDAVNAERDQAAQAIQQFGGNKGAAPKAKAGNMGVLDLKPKVAPVPISPTSALESKYQPGQRRIA